MPRALLQHLLLSLRLNFRSRQPLVYGYLVPVFFLLAFGSVFRSGTPPLLREMGQLLTITVLGGACFGMPTAMVNERERGVWRRYRLLPASTGSLLLSAMVGRYVLVLSAALLQVALAWCFYRTPLPAHPAQMFVAFTAVCFAFLGLGLIVAALADNVPAVQALGQAIFLPMIMIGGVGVPLRTLPEWAQRMAGFFPGRYAVEALQACIVPEGPGLRGEGFALAALTLVGVAACLAGTALFRWDGGQRLRLDAKRVGWLALALGTWLAVGVADEAAGTHRTSAASAVAPVTPAAPPVSPVVTENWQTVTDVDLARITCEDLPPDDGYVVPLAKGLDQLDEQGKTRLNDFQDKLSHWKPGKGDDPEQRLRNLLSVCAVPDLVQDPNESEIAYAVFEEIQNNFPAGSLRRMLGWLILHPVEGTVINNISDLGISDEPPNDQTRERVVSYARKLLFRLLQKPTPVQTNTFLGQR